MHTWSSVISPEVQIPRSKSRFVSMGIADSVQLNWVPLAAMQYWALMYVSHCQKWGKVRDLMGLAVTCQTDFFQGLLAQMFGPPGGIMAPSLKITNDATCCAVDIVALRIAPFEVGVNF